MKQVVIGGVKVSRLCIGGNPFSGFSHQTPARDQQMLDYFSTPQRIWETLDAAQAVGVNTVFARVDDHILGVLEEYFHHGGTLQWFAQVSEDPADRKTGEPTWQDWMRKAVDVGATGLYIHGGLAEFWQAQGQMQLLHEAMHLMRGFGKVCGFAGHRPDLHAWIRDHLSPDFQMCSHYNPTDRRQSFQHTNVNEKWDTVDRSAMLEVVATIACPVVHYKIFAGGNRPIEEAFVTLGQSMRSSDIACVGVFPPDDPGMIVQDVALLEKHVV